MALVPVSNEVIQEICKVLGVETLSRPHALLADSGDFGTVLTYVPLFPAEFTKLPVQLQRHVYVIGKGRYGLVAFVPKNFEIPKEEEMDFISEVYDEYGNLREMTYSFKGKNVIHRVENSLRREMLQALAKKKKFPIKKTIRSRS